MSFDFPELVFDEKPHVYHLDGVEVPSVTTLMKPLSDDFYSTVKPDVLNKAANRGTLVHHAIENYLKFGFVDIEPLYAGYLDGFLHWWETAKPEVIGTEQGVYHKVLRYAGTSDLLCTIDGKTTLVDFKTSAKVNSKLCAVQLEAYDRAWESHGVNIDNRLILHLQKDGKYQAVSFQRSSKHWSVFSALLTIHNYMNE